MNNLFLLFYFNVGFLMSSEFVEIPFELFSFSGGLCVGLQVHYPKKKYVQLTKRADLILHIAISTF